MSVYWIKNTESGRIKIGYAQSPERRLRDLQTSHDARLELLRVVDGDRRLEQALHRHFERFRLVGEWFAITNEQVFVALGTLSLRLISSAGTVNSEYPLTCYLVRHGHTLASFGKLIPASAEAVRRWAEGERFPHPDMLERIEVVTGGAVTANDFMTTRRMRSRATQSVLETKAA